MSDSKTQRARAWQARRRWRQFSGWFERWVRRPFPLTGLGAIVGAGSAFALFYFGLRRLDLILLVVGAVGLAVTVIALLATVVAALVLRRAARKQALREGKLQIECGYPVRTGFALPRPWYLPLVDATWRWVEPDGQVRIIRRGTRFIEEVTARRRGMVSEIVRVIEVGDIFGLTQLSFEVREQRSVRFTPSVGALKHIDVIRGMSAGDDLSHPSGPPEGDPFDMRRYNPGDPIRFVLWKVFARSRMLVVRTPERAISLARQTAAYLVATEGDEPAAGAARVAVDHGILGHDWILGVDGTDQIANSKSLALDLLTRSARSAEQHPERGGSGLADFMRQRVTPDTGRAVVFVPGRPGPWLDAVQAAARSRRGGGVEFVICTDGIREARPRGWLQRVLVPELSTPAPAGATDPVSREEVLQVVKALGGTRSRVVVVDRTAGRIYTAAHLEAQPS